MNKPIILIVAVIALFAFSVTIKYAPVSHAYTSRTRYIHIVERRPLYPLIDHLNSNRPEVRVFQHYFDEYRAWCEFPWMGRRNWELSWEEYSTLYPDNTAHNFHTYLSDRNFTHFIINHLGTFEAPYWDPDFPDYFSADIAYDNYVLFGVKKEVTDDEILDAIDLGGMSDSGRRGNPDDIRLQE